MPNDTTESQNTDIEKLGRERDKSLENSNTSSGTEFKSTRDSKCAGEDDDVLSPTETTASAIYDPASRVPINANLESGIVGMNPRARFLFLLSAFDPRSFLASPP